MEVKDFEDLCEEIVTRTNNYLDSYGYKYNGKEIRIETYIEDGVPHVDVIPNAIVWGEYTLTSDYYEDVFLVNKYRRDKQVKLTFNSEVVYDAPDIIVNQLFIDLLEERDFLTDELREIEEREEFEYECWRSEDWNKMLILSGF